MQNSKFPRQGRAWEDVRDERLENRGGDLPWVAQLAESSATPGAKDVTSP